MKKNILIFLSVLLTIISCKNKQETEENKIPEDIILKTEFLKNDINAYTDNKVNILVDSINNSSGFLGWKNIRDYLGMGKESMKGKVNRIWKGVYDIKHIDSIANYHISGLLLGDNINKKTNIKIKENHYIEQYAHKISLSAGFFIFELLVDNLIIGFILSMIGFLYRIITGNKNILKNVKLIVTIVISAMIIEALIFIFSDSYSQKAYKEHIINKITDNTMNQINSEYKIIIYENKN